MTFIAWLRQQKKEDTAIGDLARDVFCDRNRPRMSTSKALRKYFEGLLPGPSQACMDTLDEAETMFEEMKRNAS